MHNQEGGAVRDLLRESDDGLRVVADDERALFLSGGKFACDVGISQPVGHVRSLCSLDERGNFPFFSAGQPA